MNIHIQTLLSAVQAADETRCDVCARQLAALGAQALPGLKTLLVDPHADTRWWAVYALGLARLPEATPLLLEAMKDDDEAVRYCAVRALREQADPAAIPALLALFEQPDGLLKRLAADALIAAGAPAVVPLVEVLQKPDHPGRGQAVRALALIGDPSAIPALYAVLEEESDWITYWANEGLERMGIGMVFFNP